MAKQQVLKNVSELRKLAESNKLIIGAERTIKSIRLCKVSVVYITKNITETTKETIEKESALAKIKVMPLDYTNEELGVICKKPFRISVLSVVKE